MSLFNRQATNQVSKQTATTRPSITREVTKSGIVWYSCSDCGSPASSVVHGGCCIPCLQSNAQEHIADMSQQRKLFGRAGI